MAISTPAAGDPWTTQGGQILTAINNFEGAVAEYNQAAVQSLATGATRLAWGTENIGSALVARSVVSPGHEFTLQRAGVWAITVCLRTQAANGERHLSINDGVAEVAAQAFWTNAIAQINVSITRYFAASTVISAFVWNGTGAPVDTAGAGGQTRITFAWIHAA